MGQDDFAIEKARFESKVENLTRTQKQVLELFLQNSDDLAIAAEIGDITESTVRQHIGNIANKLGIPSDKTDKGFRRREIVKLFRQFAPERVTASHYHDEILESLNGKSAPQRLEDSRIVAPVVMQEFNLLGRDGDRQKLEEFSQQHKMVLIKAGAGIGKSTLAREFLEAQFQKVIRLEMGLESGNVTPAEEKVSQILRQNFNEEPSRDFGINLDILQEKLSDRGNPIGILINDLEPALDENYRFRENLRGYDALLVRLGDRDVASFTLITSRRSLIVPRAKVHEYLLDGLDIAAWREYFHDCENLETSESLLQMREAYSGNAKVMDILHSVVKNHSNSNIEDYWIRYKNDLLANKEIETLISEEINWLRDNQPNAYKLFYQIDFLLSTNEKLISFNELLQLLDDAPEPSRFSIIDSLLRTSLIEIKDRNNYFLNPVLCQAAKLHLWKNTSVFSELDFDFSNESNAVLNMYELDISGNVNGQIEIEGKDLYDNSGNFLQDSINQSFTQGNSLMQLSDLVCNSSQSFSVFNPASSISEEMKIMTNNIDLQETLGVSSPTNDVSIDQKQDPLINPSTTNSQAQSIFPSDHFE